MCVRVGASSTCGVVLTLRSVDAHAQEAKKNHAAMERAMAAEREAAESMKRTQDDMTELLAKTKREIDEYRRTTGNAKKCVR